MSDGKLSDEVRTFVVERLSRYESPTAVVLAVKEEFGVITTRQAVEAYDPTKAAGAKLADRWRVLFETTRKAFKTDIDAVPIAHKATRLAILNRMIFKMEAMKNYPGAAALLEQAAKEVGGAFDRKATGKADDEVNPNAPVEPRHPGADRLAAMAEQFGRPLKVVEGGKKGP